MPDPDEFNHSEYESSKDYSYSKYYDKLDIEDLSLFDEDEEE